MKRLALWAWALASGFVLALCAGAYYQMFWRWRDCFNEEGRCFVEADGVVYHAQSGPIYMILAALALFSLAASLKFLRG